MEMAEEKYIGVTDLPCEDDSSDVLNFRKYVDGLEKFVRNCHTPMSIAIQGDWGTGKTSMINMLKKRLENEQPSAGVLPCVYFNTLQYSQFNMAEDLYLSFVDTLLSGCNLQNKRKEIFKTIVGITKRYAAHTVEEKTGIDIDSLLESEQKRVDSVSGLKKSFEDIIEEKVKTERCNRIIIFIDDLDRLNPEVAVELLEVIKLFMDVPKCVFVLASDYDVVVSGVRKKYGENISEEKCRSFFDKIIQLPFTMPVNTYDLKDMVNDIIKDSIPNKSKGAVTILINEMLGSNPRAFKRLANSYCMTDYISENVHGNVGKDRDLEKALMLGILCIQISVPSLYNFLVKNEEDWESTLSLQGEDLRKEMKEQHIVITDESFWKIEKGMEAIKEMVDSLKKENDRTYDILEQTLNMSAVTNIDNGGGTRSAAMKTTGIRVNGGELVAVENTADALKKSFEMLLKGDQELAEEFRDKTNNILTKDIALSNSVFRSKKKLEGFDVELYLGTSTGSQVKKEQLEKLCKFLIQKGKAADVEWLNGDERIYGIKDGNIIC